MRLESVGSTIAHRPANWRGGLASFPGCAAGNNNKTVARRLRLWPTNRSASGARASCGIGSTGCCRVYARGRHQFASGAPSGCVPHRSETFRLSPDPLLIDSPSSAAAGPR